MFGVLAGRVAIVTGAASGIGNAVAAALLRAGSDVVAVDLRNDGPMGELEGSGARIAVGDIGDLRTQQQAIDLGGQVDFLVHSAGIIHLQPIDDVTEQDWDAIMETNARATFFLMQRVARAMPDGGAMVTMSSVSARRAVTVEAAVYAASKAAVASVTRSFAYALAPRQIRVNTVMPGLIDTPMQDRVIREAAAARGEDAAELERSRAVDVPLGRMGEPADVADTVLWLLSESSGYLTGQSIAVDGGLTMY